MKKIVINYGDGTIGIGTPHPDKDIEKYRIEITPVGATSRITDESNLVSDRYFRAAWTDDMDGEQTDINMNRARTIHMDVIRKKRDKRLDELDKRMYGAEKDIERQVLRDLPNTLNLSGAITPEELKGIWPEELNIK